MRINSNTNALNMLRNIQESQRGLRDSMAKLSSGLRINTAADDPAGLIISEKMRAQIGGIEQEIRNIDNTNNKLSTAEGNLDTQQNSLREMRNIAVAAANEGGNSEQVQQTYQQSMDNAVNGYNIVQDSAAFGTQKLLDGSEGAVANLDPITGLDVSSAEKAREAINLIDEKIEEISGLRGEIGATQKNELNARRSNLETELVNLTASESSIRDVDMAREYTNFVSEQIKLQAGMAMLAQQEQIPNLVLSFLSE